jgi:transglutaminase/protease-like cytokinesis protein 3
VLIDDEWFLIDATWDDPTGAEKPVRSTYLFTPPKLFAYDHLPEDPAWQLVIDPISPGDFARLPIMSPEIGRLGLTLESPTRSQVSVSGELVIVLDNPYGAELLAQPKNRSATCKVTTAAGKTTATCSLPDGEHEVQLFAGPRNSRGYEYIGSILANSR